VTTLQGFPKQASRVSRKFTAEKNNKEATNSSSVWVEGVPPHEKALHLQLTDLLGFPEFCVAAAALSISDA
jgi:hypothetical protein